MAGEPRVSQAGALVDAGGNDIPVRMTQAGAMVDADQQTPVRMTQAGAMVDADQQTPVRMTQTGVLLDARYRRVELAHDCWEFHVFDAQGRYLGVLDGAAGRAYLATLSDTGGGKFQIHALDAKATSAILTAGNIVHVRYRNVDVGAWIMESFGEPLVTSDEASGRIIEVSGRGLLALLKHGLVYPGDLADFETAERRFASVTKAQILAELYDEFVLRGGGDINLGFTATRDSAGLAWTDSVTLNYKAGQTLLDVARNLAGLGLELIARPDRALEAYQNAGVDRSSQVIFREGQMILSAKREREARDLINVVLGEGQGAYVETLDPISYATYRRREGYLAQRNTASVDQVAQANQLLLEKWKNPRAAYQLEVLAEPHHPFIDYDIGDIVRVDIPGQVSDDFRVLSISVRDVFGPCDLRVTLELNDLNTEYLQRVQRAFDASLLAVSPGAAAASGLAANMTDTPVGGTGVGLQKKAIKKAHIDWGTGSDQVSAADVPIADTEAYYIGEDVEAALDEIGAMLLAPQPANHVLAGPVSGPDAGPAFRVLTAAADVTDALLVSGARSGATSQAQVFTTGITLPATTSSATGVVWKDTTSFIHDFRHPTGLSAAPAGRNTFIGIGAGNFTAGSSATSANQASYNVGIGYNALIALTLGQQNLALGYAALSALTSGDYNTGIGASAMAALNTGTSNVAIGRSTMLAATSASSNVAVGTTSLYALTSGAGNTAVARNSLYNVTTGDYNAAIGYAAGYGLTTGSYNVYLGYQAGRYLADGSSANQTSSRGVYIGRDVKASAAGVVNETAIGYNAIGIGSNTIMIGGSSVTTTALAGNVGIGTTVPGALLHGVLTNATTNAVDNQVIMGHDSSGTPAAGFGARLLLRLKSSTTAAQSAAAIDWSWQTATHASRSADMVLSAYDYGGVREILRCRATGSAAAVGFLGATPSARLSHVADPSGGSTVDAEARSAINSILTTLETFGFHATS